MRFVGETILKFFNNYVPGAKKGDAMRTSVNPVGDDFP